MAGSHRNNRRSAFTLIEMSIVLVIIGLLAAVIVIGQDLMNAAAARAQISQIQKYQAAVHTFQNKYGFLPGDIPNPTAPMFGFASRGNYAGEGDGNGLMEGVDHNASNVNGGLHQTGENIMFWVDLSTAGLIDGGFSTATPTTNYATALTGSVIDAYLPQAKVGGVNYIYVMSGGWQDGDWGTSNGTNYYGLSQVTSIGGTGCEPCLFSKAGLTVQQAYNIDSKIDDGLPLTGNVLSAYINSDNWYWAEGTYHAYMNAAAPTSAIGGSTTTCFDNGNNANNPMQYSLKQTGGTGMNCALTFQFQ